MRSLILTSLALLLAYSSGTHAAKYRVETLVPGSRFHGVHGLAIDSRGRLLAGTVIGQTLYEVDRKTGSIRSIVEAPVGEADDIAIAPDGTIAWTGFTFGDVYVRKDDGPVRRIATGLPGINSLAYTADGRLFASRVFIGDELYELDAEGRRPPRKVMENLGGLNGFEFGPDGLLYGPLWFKGQVVRIDVTRAKLEVVASGFVTPAAVNFDARGNLYVIDTARGELLRVDIATGSKKLVAQLQTALDNLAIDPASGNIYVSNMADNSIQEVNPSTGDIRQIIRGTLAFTGGVALAEDNDTLYVADVFAFRAVSTRDSKVRDIARMHADPARFPPLEHPFNVSVSARHVVLTSWYNGAVQFFDRNGSSSDIWHGFKQPQHAVELDDGSVLVVESATGHLLRAKGVGGTQRDIVAQDLQSPLGLAVHDQLTYVSEADGGRISSIDLRTGKKRVVRTGLKQPEGIALDNDNKLLIAEVGQRRIVQLDLASGELVTIAEHLPIGLQAPRRQPASYAPTGIAVSRTGVIYLSSDIENAIYRITPVPHL